MPKYYASLLLAFAIITFKSYAQNNELLDIKSLIELKPEESLSKVSAQTIKLSLKKQKLKSIPAEVYDLVNLQYLDLSKNNIDSISPQIKNLKNLQVLYLNKNKIYSIPSELYELTNLKIISLNSNEINYISPSIQKLLQLEILDLWNTNVTSLPEQITRLEKLKEIDLRGITMNPTQQQQILDLLPNVKILLSAPCNCGI